LQTIRLPHQNDCSLEVFTCICKIQEESPAHLSGLQPGDILSSINGVNTDGFSHKQIVDLIKSSGNYLRLETVNGAMLLRKMELETKLHLLKRVGGGSLLMAQVGACGAGYPGRAGTCVCPAASTPTCGPSAQCPAGVGSSPEEETPQRRSLSQCPCTWLLLRTLRELQEESWGHAWSFPNCVCDMYLLSPQQSLQQKVVELRSLLVQEQRLLHGSLATSGSMSPLWEAGSCRGSCSGSFGTLPRKSRRASVRKQLLKFIPGLQRAVEEEESRV
ncbi:Cytohesin-interacting protein, partial [Dryobates pubescens]